MAFRSTRPAEITALTAVLASLVGAPQPRVSATLDWSSLDLTEVVAAASRHRVVGLVVSAPEAERLPTQAVAALRQRHRQQLLRAMRQAAQLTHLLHAYREARIPLLLLKGQAFSQQAYGDWAARGTSTDVDFLVAPQAIGAAQEVMLKLGYFCAHDEGHIAPLRGLHGRYNRWLHYERSYRAPGQSSVDVHWRPVPGSAAWTQFDAIWAERTHVELHGVEVATPGLATTLRIAAGQGEPDGWPNLRSVTDVLAAAQLLPGHRLTEVRLTDPLVATALANAADVLEHGNPQWWDPRPRRESVRWRREWDLRRHTDNPPRAAARSVLGKWLPARRFSRIDSNSTDPSVAKRSPK